MKLNSSIIMFALMVLFSIVGAQNIFADQAASSELANLLNAVHTMQANFVQTIYDNKGKTIQKSYGEMALDRPGKFRWQVKKPIPQLIIAKESRIWIYDPDLEQLTIRTLHQSSGNTPALLLSHVNGFLDKDYDVKIDSKNPSLGKAFLLKPRQADSMFLNIEMYFKDNQIIKMSFADHLGHSTSIEFKNAVINKGISEKLFNFKPPANVDIINETKAAH